MATGVLPGGMWESLLAARMATCQQQQQQASMAEAVEGSAPEGSGEGDLWSLLCRKFPGKVKKDAEGGSVKNRTRDLSFLENSEDENSGGFREGRGLSGYSSCQTDVSRDFAHSSPEASHNSDGSTGGNRRGVKRVHDELFESETLTTSKVKPLSNAELMATCLALIHPYRKMPWNGMAAKGKPNAWSDALRYGKASESAPGGSGGVPHSKDGRACCVFMCTHFGLQCSQNQSSGAAFPSPDPISFGPFPSSCPPKSKEFLSAADMFFLTMARGNRSSPLFPSMDWNSPDEFFNSAPHFAAQSARSKKGACTNASSGKADFLNSTHRNAVPTSPGSLFSMLPAQRSSAQVLPPLKLRKREANPNFSSQRKISIARGMKRNANAKTFAEKEAPFWTPCALTERSRMDKQAGGGGSAAYLDLELKL